MLLLFGLVFIAAPQDTTFRARAPLVLVPVTVSDKHGQTLDGLSSDDFLLFDNQKLRPANVDPAGVYRSGVSAVLVVQTSGISHAALLKVRKTGSLIEGYITGEDGDAAVISANEDLKTVQGFTSDGLKIRSAFRQLAPDGEQGRIVDGVAQAVQMLSAKTPERRKIVVTISESRDRGSKARVQNVLTAAQNANVTIYTVTYSAYVTPFTTHAEDLGSAPDNAGINLLLIATEIGRLAKQNIGIAFAEYTGGRHVSFSTLNGLENDLASIGKEVHSQYLLSFAPERDREPGYHTIAIKVRSHPEALVRARPGYWTDTEK
jgi:VWFA-related protein